MEFDLFRSNFLNPPILFFFLGMLVVFLKSDLQIPAPIPKLFSLYLLLCIGFTGGAELGKSGITHEVIMTMGASIMIAILAPVYLFFILRRKVNVYNAGAIAATYGSVSAVTFITATVYLKSLGIEYGGHMVAALALMESPAIIIGIVLVRLFAKDNKNKEVHWAELFKEAFASGPVFLIIGSLLIGFLSGEEGAAALKPFTTDIFKGMLVFFMLDLGILAAQRIGDLRRAGLFLAAFSVIAPLVNALIGFLLAHFLGFSQGNAFLFIVLCSSASYIAVPAAMRLSVPEANPSLYVPMSLALTFPLNIVFGLPFYFHLLQKFAS